MGNCLFDTAYLEIQDWMGNTPSKKGQKREKGTQKSQKHPELADYQVLKVQ